MAESSSRDHLPQGGVDLGKHCVPLVLVKLLKALALLLQTRSSPLTLESGRQRHLQTHDAQDAGSAQPPLLTQGGLIDVRTRLTSVGRYSLGGL